MDDETRSSIARIIAPSGTLRAAINFGNPVLAQRDPANGAPRGVSAEIATELARRLSLPLTFVMFDAAGKVFDALDAGAWDVAFLAIDPKRATNIDFTGPYVIIEGGYVVPASSALQAITDVDRVGVRIAVATGSAYALYLARTLTQAELVYAESGEASTAQFLEARLDVLAGVKSPLRVFVAGMPGMRLLDGRFMAIEQAVGLPRGRDAAARYVCTVVEELKGNGFIADALARTGQQDAQVAPARQPD